MANSMTIKLLNLFGGSVEPSKLSEAAYDKFVNENGLEYAANGGRKALELWRLMKSGMFYRTYASAGVQGTYAEVQTSGDEFFCFSIRVTSSKTYMNVFVRRVNDVTGAAVALPTVSVNAIEKRGTLIGAALMRHAGRFGKFPTYLPDACNRATDFSWLGKNGAAEYLFAALSNGYPTGLHGVVVGQQGDVTEQDLQFGEGTELTSWGLAAPGTAVSSVHVGAYTEGAGAFSLNDYVPEESLTSIEVAKIPTEMPQGFVKNEKVAKMASLIQKSFQFFSDPTCNIGLYGDAGSGKSVAARYLAFLLGLPFYRFLCTDAMTGDDTYGGFQPRTEKSVSNLPSMEDVEMDWEGCYQQLFGVAPDASKSKLDVLAEMDKRSKGGKEDGDFVFVPSEIIKAMKYGGVVEVGEAAVVRSQGALTALNNLLEKGSNAFIQLTTGERVYRHPLCIVVFTTNVDYAGCKPLNESILSRIDKWVELQTPDEQELANRVYQKCVTSDGTPLFVDKGILLNMAKTITKMAAHAKQDELLAGGSIGMREFESWAREAVLLQMMEDGADKAPDKISMENVIKAAETTLLSKSCQDRDGRAEINAAFTAVWGLDACRKAGIQLS